MELSSARRSQSFSCSVGLHQHACVVSNLHTMFQCLRWRVRIGIVSDQLLHPYFVSWIVGQQLVWDSWILTDDELVWSESASISSPILQRRSCCQEILQIVRCENNLGLESLRQTVLNESPCLSHSPFCQGASASTIICRMPAYAPDCAKSPRHSAPPSV